MFHSVLELREVSVAHNRLQVPTSGNIISQRAMYIAQRPETAALNYTGLLYSTACCRAGIVSHEV